MESLPVDPSKTSALPELKEFLEEKYELYNQPSFIDNDPICIPHSFSKKEDIEIAGFLTATIAWGQRKTIINNGFRLMKLMDNDPLDFIISSNLDNDYNNDLKAFKHRTFNGMDCIYFLKSLQHIYRNQGGLHNVFKEGIIKHRSNMQLVISDFKKKFFELPHPLRTRKHVSDPLTNSAAKRINMFLRWMVRKDDRNVDFGIWNDIDARHLRLPLDVHTGTVARKLGLLKRKQNDWKAVEEVTGSLSEFDRHDPVKYDYALFGLGIVERF